MQQPSTTTRSPEAAVIGSVSRSSDLDFDFVELPPEPVLESQSCCGGCGVCYVCNAGCFGCVVDRHRSSEGDGRDIKS